MRDYDAEFDFWLNGGISADYVFDKVLEADIAHAIEDAAHLAFIGRWAEAEKERRRGGYAGLGLIDYGAVAAESEESRRRFRRALEDDT